MSSVDLSSCCSCHAFSNQFAHLFLVKRVKCSAIFLLTTKTTQPRPKVFSVNCSIIEQFAARQTSFFHISQNSSKFGRQQVVMMNYAWDFSQSETEKYFERIITVLISPHQFAPKSSFLASGHFLSCSKWIHESIPKFQKFSYCNVSTSLPCQSTITWMSIRMSTIKLNTDCICLGHLASNDVQSLQENSQSERACYCN